MKLFLWRLHAVTGYWRIEREVTRETAQQWLDIYRKDEPSARFTVSRTRPKDAAARALRR